MVPLPFHNGFRDHVRSNTRMQALLKSNFMGCTVFTLTMQTLPCRAYGNRGIEIFHIDPGTLRGQQFPEL